MTKNLGRLDQAIRVAISLSLIYAGIIDEQFIGDPLSSIIIGAIGVINLIVALTRICPLYILADINTCRSKQK